MAAFTITGSYEIPVLKQRLGGRKVDSLHLHSFWAATGDYADHRGCYIFSMKAGRGEKPWYVGKASRQSFSKECFAIHKLGIYNDVLGNLNGKPRLTFVIPTRTRGSWPTLAIDEVEEFLIGHAATRNVNIANKRRLPNQNWTIHGVVPTGKGAPSREAASFKKLMGI